MIELVLRSRLFSVALLAALTAFLPSAFGQTANFQIVWVNVGEVAATANGATIRAGRQLFMAPDLVGFSLDKVTIAQVDVDPNVVALKVGQRFCLTSLRVQARSENRAAVENAPLSVSVRQDHRARLALKRSKQDICFRPTEGGEYPVRLTSLLPARDGTTRGAQIYLRVAEAPRTSAPEMPGDVPVAN